VISHATDLGLCGALFQSASKHKLLMDIINVDLLYVLIMQTMFHNILSTLLLQEQVSCRPVVACLSGSCCTVSVSNGQFNLLKPVSVENETDFNRSNRP